MALVRQTLPRERFGFRRDDGSWQAGHVNALRFSLVAVASLILFGCDSKTSSNEASSEEEPMSAEEKQAMQAATPFLQAIAGGDHAAAYAQLSSHAKARMSQNQFLPPDDEAAAKANDAKAVTNPSLQDFQRFLALAANELGSPTKIISSSVMSTDPEELSGKGNALEAAFTVGLMPDSIPTNIRKASVRSQVGVVLTPGQLKDIATQQGLSVEELEKDTEFAPYCNLKVVLVDEGGQLKVGYFEFTPPSMWD